MVYTKPGRYVAICHKTNFDGHYVKVFDFPADTGVDAPVDAVWWFLNMVDFVACVDKVYPIEIFAPIKDML